ncbi:MAG: hypothetical protein JWP89_6830 [Schlesneria sp.]|nr:hypothetical protein [Schlesneria sp.]
MIPSFLQTAFLYGLAAIAVPVLIHLFFRLRTKRVELGTIRFLRIALEENARRRKVMRWLLLTLRILLVALLVGLFARPYFTAAATGGDKELLVVLIDQSATMQLKGENGRLIDQAVADARKLIEAAGTQTRIEVAFFDHEVHPVTDSKIDGSATSSVVLSKVQAPSLLFGATSFGSAIAWARDVCVKAPVGAKQLHLFTDLQQSGLDWAEIEPLPAEVSPHLHDVGRPIVNNAAVTEVRTPRLWVRPGESPTIRASVLNAGTFALNEVAIVLEIGRVEVADDRSVSERSRTESKVLPNTDFAKLAERITKRERVKLEPGSTITLDFDLPALSEGLWQGRVTAEYDDDLPFDNQRYFAISATPAYRVLVVSGEADGASVTSETYFLDAALRLAELGDSYSASPFAPTLMSYVDGASLPKLSDFDATVLVNVPNITPLDAASLASFVQGGGGLLVFTGDNVTAASCAALTHAGLSAGEIGEIKVTNDLPWRLNHWDAKHPVFEPLSDPQHGDLRRLVFAAYTKVTPAKDASVLAQFSTNAPAVLERRVGNGTVLWVTTSCGREWSDWCRSQLFLPTVHQLLGYEVGLTAGGRVRMRLVDVESRSPNPADEEQNGPIPSSEASFSTTAKSDALPRAALRPGVEQSERYAEVINTSPRESDTDRCTVKEFEERFAIKVVEGNGTSVIEAKGPGNVELRQDEFWHWVAYALLAVLLLEGFVGNRTTA